MASSGWDGVGESRKSGRGDEETGRRASNKSKTEEEKKSRWVTSEEDVQSLTDWDLIRQIAMRGVHVRLPWFVIDPSPNPERSAKKDTDKISYECRRTIQLKLMNLVERENDMIERNDPYIWSTCENKYATSEHGEYAPRPRETAACAVYEDGLYIFGGYAYGTRLKCLEKYSFTTCTWSEIKAEGGPGERSWMSAAVYKDAMYIFGGLGESECFSDVHRFEFKTKKWTLLECKGDDVPCARSKYDAFVFEEYMYIYGGKDWDESPLKDLYRLNLRTYRWNRVPTTGERPRGDAKDGCAYQLVYKHYLIVFSEGTVFKLNLLTNEWIQCVTFGNAPTRRPNGTGVVLANDALFVFDQDSHGDPPCTLFAKVYRLCLRSMVWTAEKTYRYPISRLGSTCVVNGEMMYCFGGSTGSPYEECEYLNTLTCIKLQTSYRPRRQSKAFHSCLFNEAKYADVMFRCDGRRLYAHKAILACQSDYFDGLFKFESKRGPRRGTSPSTMKDDASITTKGDGNEMVSDDKDNGEEDNGLDDDGDDGDRSRRIDVVDVTSVKYPIFVTILKYLYGCSRVTPSDALELLVATDMYFLKDLRRECVKVISEGLDSENVLSVLTVAETVNEEHLKRFCNSYIMDNFLSVVSSPTFKDLCQSRPELVQEFCKANASIRAQSGPVDHRTTTTKSARKRRRSHESTSPNTRNATRVRRDENESEQKRDNE